MKWRVLKEDGFGFLSLWGFFFCEIKYVEFFRMFFGVYRFIFSLENRNVYVVVRKVYYVVVVKLELVL